MIRDENLWGSRILSDHVLKSGLRQKMTCRLAKGKHFSLQVWHHSRRCESASIEIKSHARSFLYIYVCCLQQEEQRCRCWKHLSLTPYLSAQLKWLRSVINFAKHKKCGCAVILSIGIRLLLAAHINSGWTSFGRFLPLDAVDTLVWCINYARAVGRWRAWESPGPEWST